jgi:hypothetical protein
MKRVTRLDGAAVANRDELVVEIRHATVGAWALEIMLLSGAFAEEVVVHLGDGWTIALRMSGDPEARRSAFTSTGERSYTCVLSRTQLGYVQGTLLRAYRDEVAEVNHIHVEGLLGDSPFDMTLMFERYREPMSPEEAEKAILGKV